ncbi:MAG: IMS domain-containing protein [Chamaesiphon sp.]|nr:IMS domain-containing protein [Chamaesiphon sp.]
MRIPLDYYQILGVPESNLSELEQAYHDRLLQLPRQEYSDAAIESRKQLITMAYQVLRDPQQRAEYAETQLSPALAETSEDSPLYCRRELDVATEHFLGGLLILFEQGEYEEINSICMPYLGNNGRNSNSGSLHPHPLMSVSTSGNLRGNLVNNIDPTILAKLKHTATGDYIIPLKPDIILAMVSSFYELGEREWGDRCYEAAVIHYETAKKILVQEDIFPQIQGQIDLKLDRLRPYRISCLVALPLDQVEQRGQGIQFLEELLESACTNELKCQERFGLNGERTIEFIYQTLPHLTAAEQRNLFSQIARDAQQLGTKALNGMQLACTYLHVHALIIQGFAYRNPQLIYTAQQILQYRLSQRWDVTILQAICALLLGQTEEADRILQTGSESAALLVIRQQSNGLTNLTRGLCFYAESWLKDEAFPYFRDLVTNGNPALEAYFSDRDVQDFADRVPTNDGNLTSWAASSPQLIDVPPSGDLSGSLSLDRSTGEPRESTARSTIRETSDLSDILPKGRISATGGRRSSSLITAWQPHSDRLGSAPIIPAVRVEQPSLPLPVPTPTPELPVTATTELEESSNVIQLERERQRRRSMPTARTIDGQFEQLYPDRPQTLLSAETSGELVTTAKAGKLVKTGSRSGPLVRPRKIRRKANIPRILLVGTGGVACIWGATWLVTAIGSAVPSVYKTIVNLTAAPNPAASNKIDTIQTAPKPAPATAKPELLTTDIAQQTVKTWLSAKAKSLDRGYQTAPLKDILVEPALSTALNRSKAAKGSNIHWQYQHQNIGVLSIAPANPLANAARIKVQVDENAQSYKAEQLDPDNSYSKKVTVEYNLVRQQGRWYIKDVVR